MPKNWNTLTSRLIVAAVFTGALLCTSSARVLGATRDFTKAEIESAARNPDLFAIDAGSIRIEEIKEIQILKRGSSTTFPSPNGNNWNQPWNNPQPWNDPWNNNNNNGDTLVVIDKIINLAEKIFTIIERNKPVVDINVNYANAVPQGTNHWTQLQNWKRPMTKTYAFSSKNYFGSEVIRVKYQVTWTYGGDYQGKGKFLTGVTVEPLAVKVLWGYKFSLVAEVPDSTIINVGTSEDPIAAMQVNLKWKIATVLKETNGKNVYFIQGDGFFQQIGDAFKKSSLDINEIDSAKPLKEGINW